MLTLVDKLIISKNAQAWLANRNLIPLDWDELPGFPDPLIPVWAVTEEARFNRLPIDAEMRAGLYRLTYDPDETSNWAFVPGLEDRVWMVHVRRRSPDLN